MIRASLSGSDDASDAGRTQVLGTPKARRQRAHTEQPCPHRQLHREEFANHLDLLQVGEAVEVRVLGDPGNALATGEVAAILAPATAEDTELVELNTGVIGHVRPQQANVQHQFSVANALMPAPVTVSDIPVSGAALS